MKKPKIKLKLKKLHWEVLATDLRLTFQMAPVKDWALQTYIIADLYEKKMAFFTVYPYTSKGVNLNLTMIQAIAINEFLSANSAQYNALIRMKIEPKLILG